MVGLDSPCDQIDKKKIFFRAATRITIGDGAIARFWESTWKRGRQPKDVLPQVYAISKRKNRTLREAIADDT